MRVLVCLGLLTAAWADTTVAVTGGKIAGAELAAGGAVFKGIPYAQPPVGDLRWREPRPVAPWSGIRAATVFSPPCAQNSGGKPMPNSSEDCLYLNVWTPEWPPGSRKPVMVWLHGGGNYGGTASTNNFDGEKLAHHGVVLVTLNYRLTIFGFFAHPELTRESPHHASGNYGLMDQIAALKWVRDNIGKFGGDPGNVTLFGQSAGAVDTNVLMTSPLTKGLFHKAIAESGTVTRNPDPATMNMTALGPLMKVKEGPLAISDAPELAQAERTGESISAELNAPANGALKFLRGLPAAELLKVTAAPQKSIGPANGVIVDGWVFPKPPALVFASAQEHRIPLLIGNNARERTPPGAADLPQAIEAMYGSLAPRAFALYAIGAKEIPPPDPLYGNQAAQWVVDTMYRCPVVAQLVWHAGAGNASYEYQFDRPAVGRENLGAVHGAEIGFVFGTLDADRYSASDRDLSAAMQKYWTNFAKSGNPNSGGLPNWPKFDVQSRGYMEFTAQGPSGREGLRRAFCDLYVENVNRLAAIERQR
jgi:para-nitrobenzyl esterase